MDSTARSLELGLAYMSPLLFILVHWCTLGATNADDLAVIADTLEKCIIKLKAWKNDMENRGLRVKMKKTKFMISGAGLDMFLDCGAFRRSGSKLY